MEWEKTAYFLRKIRDLYAEICRLSQTVVFSLTPEEFESVIERRGDIMHHIAEHQSVLEKESAGWQERFAGNIAICAIVKDIRRLISTCIECDTALMVFFRKKTAIIKNELSGIPATARAVAAYAGQRKH